MTQTTVYAESEYSDLDISAIMRAGHPDIRQGDERITSMVEGIASRSPSPLRILDLGAGSGVLSRRLAERIPGAEIIYNEIERNLILQARRRLEDTNVQEFARPFHEWDEPLDVIISWGTHHHVPGYLQHARELLAANGTLILGDEFCPEYLDDQEREALRVATHVEVIEGFTYIGQEERKSIAADGAPPPVVRAREERRQRALWHWYKHVIDFAWTRNCLPVVLAELQIARDDLTTHAVQEHKLSPAFVEREVALADFQMITKEVLGSADPTLQSFVVYEYRPGNSV